MRKLLILTSLLFLLTTSVFATDVYASTFEKFKDSYHKKTPEEIETYKTKLREQKENDQDFGKEVTERKEQRVHALCDVIEERVQSKITRFEQNKDDHVDKYERVRQKLEDVVEKLEDEGFDVTDLKEHLLEFDQMIKDYAQMYVDFIESLENTQNYACGESEGDFKEALEKSHELLRMVREKRKELREYYRDVIRQDIKDLRQQAAAMYEVSEGEEE